MSWKPSVQSHSHLDGDRAVYDGSQEIASQFFTVCILAVVCTLIRQCQPSGDIIIIEPSGYLAGTRVIVPLRHAMHLLGSTGVSSHATTQIDTLVEKTIHSKRQFTACWDSPSLNAVVGEVSRVGRVIDAGSWEIVGIGTTRRA